MSKTLDAMGLQLSTLLRKEASAFLKDNAAAVSELGEEAVRAIFAQEVSALFPATIDTPADASFEMRLAIEENNAVRSEVFQLVAKAEKENAELVKKVRGSAVNVAANLAKSIAGVVLGLGAKLVMGA